MHDIIQQIVDLDKKARAQTEAVHNERINSEKAVAQKRVEMRAEFLEQARASIPATVAKEKREAEDRFNQISARNTELSRQLDDMYQRHGDDWAKQLVERVVG